MLMSFRHFVAVCVSLFAFATLAHADLIEVSGNHKGNHYHVYTYEASDLDKSWDYANSVANKLTDQGRPGHLVTITTPEENAFIESLWSQTTAAMTGGPREYWIGGFQAPTGDWNWVNGEGVIPTNNAGPSYANWEPGEPNEYYGGNPEENHIGFGLYGTDTWNDEGALGNMAGYIVEFEATAVPEPSAFTCLGLIGLIGLARRRVSR